MGDNMVPVSGVPLRSSLPFLKLVNDAHRESHQKIIEAPNEAVYILEKPHSMLPAQFFVHQDAAHN